MSVWRTEAQPPDAPHTLKHSVAVMLAAAISAVTKSSATAPSESLSSSASTSTSSSPPSLRVGSTPVETAPNVCFMPTPLSNNAQHTLFNTTANSEPQSSTTCTTTVSSRRGCSWHNTASSTTPLTTASTSFSAGPAKPPVGAVTDTATEQRSGRAADTLVWARGPYTAAMAAVPPAQNRAEPSAEEMTPN